MSLAIEPQLVTFEEFLDLPEDGISRELICGQIRERGLTIHNRHHAKSMKNRICLDFGSSSVAFSRVEIRFPFRIFLRGQPMSVAALPPLKLMTAEEFMRIPEDGIARELILGEVQERGMTLRNHMHGEVVANVSHLLKLWNGDQPRPRGRVAGGDAGFRLRRDPDVLVGPDVAYASADLVAMTPRTPSFYDGPPLLAVEVISPSDKHEDIVDKIRLYLDAGVVVWEVDPDFRRVTVHRPGSELEMRAASQELSGDPYLPGFRVSVAAIFDD